MFKHTLALVGLLLLSPFSNSALIEAGWPPPGGVTYTSSGGVSPAHTGGKTWHFSAFDDSAYDELYYSVKYLEIGENGGSPMTYNAGSSNLAGGISVWTNTFQFYNAQTGQTLNQTGVFTLTVTDSCKRSTNTILA